MRIRCLRPLEAGALLAVTALLTFGSARTAIAQAHDDASIARVEAQYAQARRELGLAQARLRVSRMKRPSLAVHAGLGWQLGEWTIHEDLDGFGAVSADIGLSYRQFWSSRAGISIGAGMGRSRVALAKNEGNNYEFGRKDLYIEAALHLSPRVGSRFYLGPTFRVGYWRPLRDGLDFVDPEGFAWGPYSRTYDRVPIGNAWAFTGGPHVGWLLGRRSDFDINLVGLAGVWDDGARFSLVGGAQVRFGYVLAIGG